MSKTFKYEHSNEDLPVERGDLWALDGTWPIIWLYCADIISGDYESNLRPYMERRGVSHDCFYSDPPWDTRVLRSFENGLGTDESKSTTNFFPDFMDAFISIAYMDSTPVAIEMGRRNTEETCKLIRSKAGVLPSVIDIVYDKKHPCSLIYSTDKCEDMPDLRGVDDTMTPELFMSSVGTTIVLDPCMGLGTTAVCASTIGAGSIGMELSPRKSSYFLNAMSNLTGRKPILIDRIGSRARSC